MKYIRFVVGARIDNPWQLTGIITIAKLNFRKFNKKDQLLIRQTYDWMNKCIPVPPFSKKIWTEDAVSWWIEKDAKKIINRLQPLIKILRKKFVVRTMRTNRPGKIVYRDKFQIVAETPKKYL